MSQRAKRRSKPRMGAPLFDLSAASAVQTVFEPADGLIDPWGVHLAGSFLNIFVYSDQVRFSLPVADSGAGIMQDIIQPSIIHDLASIDGNVLSAVPYSTSDKLILTKENLDLAFNRFYKFVMKYKGEMIIFCKLHSTQFMSKYQTIRIKNRHTYDLSIIENSNQMLMLAHNSGISVEMLVYAFDLCLRYPLYVQLTGKNEYYLNHKIRDAFGISGTSMIETRVNEPPIPLSFAPSIRPMVRNLNRDEYITTIKILREKVRETGIINLKREEISRETIREIAASAKLRPRLNAEHYVWNHVEKIVGAAVGGIILAAGGTSSANIASTAALVSGTAVKITVDAWRKGKAPLIAGHAAEIGCLRWALKWDIEDEENKK